MDSPGAGKLIINGGGNSRVLYIDNNTSSGGAFILNAPFVQRPVVITGSHFSDNSSGTSGGGLLAKYGPLTISDCTFSRNHALGLEGLGGALFANQTSLTVSSSVFAGNASGELGGAINAASGGAGLVNGCRFTGNAAFLGGALDFAGDRITLKNSVLTGNTASDQGGAVRFIQSEFTITGGLFTGNTSNLRGGAIFAYVGSSGSILGATISGNAAKVAGGGIYNDGTAAGAITVQIAKVAGNTAPTDPDIGDKPGDLSTFKFV